MSRIAIVVSWLVVVGCSGKGSGGEDASTDAPVACRSNDDCSDGLYCNGAERCEPGEGADARGCRSGASPCPLLVCDEATRTCGEECPDADGDGALDAACGGTDCDDTNDEIGPDATEVCDAAGVDEDCDPSTVAGDEGDVDEDGFEAERCCNGERCGTDCDDADRAINPGSVDACGGGDQDCDGSIDENPDQTFYRDMDGDGFGIERDTVTACGAPGSYAVLPGDCDDEDRNVNPSADEVCDGSVNEDCDDGVDEACPCTPEGREEPCDTEFAGVGVCRAGVRVCTADGWTGCLDSVLPRAEECNADSRDENCDGMVDESCECINGTTRRCGMDVGRCQSVLQTCSAGAWPRSCEAQEGVIGPAPEICNGGVDDDCDGMVDEGCECINGTTRGCGDDTGYCQAGTQTCSSGEWGPCVGAIGPRTETCNGIDDDCDGVPDNLDRDIAGLGAVCGTNAGLCRRGTQECNETALVCGGMYVGPTTGEVCDHVNEDCDTRIDEDTHQTCTWDSASLVITDARASFHGCIPSACPDDDRPSTVIHRMVENGDLSRRALYLNSGDLVDWGGSTFRVTSTFLYTRPSSPDEDAQPLAVVGTVITPERRIETDTMTSDLARALPTVPPGRRGYAAVFDPITRQPYLYQLSNSGPRLVANSDLGTSLPSECSPSPSNPTMHLSVQLQASYGELRASVFAWGPPGCDATLTATTTVLDWESAVYGTSSTDVDYEFPRYEIGVITDPRIANGTIDIESLLVQRLAPVSLGMSIGDRGHCVGCPSTWR